MSTDNWRKSSYSPNAANCVYVSAGDNHTVRLRESDAPDAILTATPGTFSAFIRAVKADVFGRLAAD
ncbi:hypothetical protein SBI_04325 [Streptomyces bingchenggensis BCW-1]|uniref:DUF397 domain-containing protein n=1 Tax=Streptomyces bingchenggensis (strain BCW-1) TaxID=749414 RepID=D7BTK6_STRBB|nr:MULTISPECIES: DUF397 domain-containing protein [Streptomyces]ADI07445.1 hypothetical protein SBI_04325 [Streptomyces bingchenggensis BCW-1]